MKIFYIVIGTIFFVTPQTYAADFSASDVNEFTNSVSTINTSTDETNTLTITNSINSNVTSQIKKNVDITGSNRTAYNHFNGDAGKTMLFFSGGADNVASIDYLEISGANVAINNRFKNLTIGNSNFINNNNTIYNNGGGLTVNDGVKFSNNNNTANLGGGAVNNANGGNLNFGAVIFNDNTAKTGGAIYSVSKGSTLDFDGASFTGNKSTVSGGAIYVTQPSGGTQANTVLTVNNATLDNNSSSGVNTNEGGGGIYIGQDITANINNGSFDNNTAANGGQIYSSNGTINLSGNNSFTNGSATAKIFGSGGAIANMTYGVDQTGKLNFIGRNLFQNNSAVNGGAIYQNAGSEMNVNEGNLDTELKFIGNTATGNGGAIGNYGKVIVNSNAGMSFQENKAQHGGAIYNGGTEVVMGSTSFIGNTATGNGGAIYTYSNATTKLSSAYIQNSSAGEYGGALFNAASGTTIVDNVIFSNNYAGKSGGAVYNYGNYQSSSATTYLNNEARYDGGAIYNNSDLGLTITGGYFTQNTAGVDGGAIYNNKTLNLSTSNSTILFSENTSKVGNNDIHNDENGGVININGDSGNVHIGSGFSGRGEINKSGQGQLTLAEDSDSIDYLGKFTQTEGTTNVFGRFFSGESLVTGGTLNWMTDKIKFDYGSLKVTGAMLNIGDDTSNHVLTLNNPDDEIMADAIVNLKANATIKNEDGTVTINNDGDDWEGKIYNQSRVILDGYTPEDGFIGEFYQDGGKTTLKNGSKVTFDDKTSIVAGNIEITEDSVLTVGPQANFERISNLYLNTGGVFNSGINPITIGDRMYIDRGTFNAMGGNTTVNNVYIIDVGAGGGNFNVDINAAEGISDSFVADYIIGTGNLNLNDFQIVGSAPTAERILVKVFDSKNIESGVTFTTSQDKAYTPLYVYTLTSEGDGTYLLTRPAEQKSYNKQAYRGQVAALSTVNNQLFVNQNLFDHVYLDSEELSTKPKSDSRDRASLFAPYQYTNNQGGLWYKPYGIFDDFHMSNGLNIDNKAYGSIFGADLTPIQLKNGWKFLPTPYIAYNEGHQKFNGVNMHQKGGQAGFMGTFLHEDFITSVLAYAGGYQNEMKVQGYKDTDKNWFAGSTAKTAYNYRPIKNLIIQPNILVSYMMLGKQNWNSDFGQISMGTGALNGTNVAPGLNVIYGTQDWNVYGSVQYMHYFNDKLNGNIDGQKLDDIKMKHGYMNYGVGFTRKWEERFMGYFQVSMFDGSINGVGLQGGITYKF